MRMSEQGRSKLIELEGFKTHVYKDSAGLPTIGVGHLITADELARGYILIERTGIRIPWAVELSVEQVDAILEQDLPDYEEAVNGLVTVSLDQYEFDALVSFCFNVGETQFSASTLLKKVNSHEFDAVPDEFRKWNKAMVKQRKRVVKGLVNRREAEIAMWRGGHMEQTPPQYQPQPGEQISTVTTTDGEELIMIEPAPAPKKPWHSGWKTHVGMLISAGIGIAGMMGYIPGMTAADGADMLQTSFGVSGLREAAPALIKFGIDTWLRGKMA